MDRHDISRIVGKIEGMTDDDEMAHATEDDLRESFISFIGSNPDVPEDIREMAQIVLSTNEIVFSRWCA